MAPIHRPFSRASSSPSPPAKPSRAGRARAPAIQGSASSPLPNAKTKTNPLFTPARGGATPLSSSASAHPFSCTNRRVKLSSTNEERFLLLTTLNAPPFFRSASSLSRVKKGPALSVPRGHHHTARGLALFVQAACVGRERERRERGGGACSSSPPLALSLGTPQQTPHQRARPKPIPSRRRRDLST